MIIIIMIIKIMIMIKIIYYLLFIILYNFKHRADKKNREVYIHLHQNKALNLQAGMKTASN